MSLVPMSRAAVALATACLALGAAPSRAAPPGSPWGEKYFPNVELVTHEGKKVKFYDDLVRDKRVVISMIYTSCTKVCGLMTANLARVRRELGDRVGKDIHFYSISLDPEHDTPAVLKEYAASFKTGPGWTFLTGAKEDIKLIRKRFGDMAPVEDHAPRINVGNDPDGQWWSTSALDNPRYLATMIAGWMDPSWTGGEQVAAASYSRAPAIPKFGPGQGVYRQKCAACHLPNGGSVGPDLAGVVARRGEAWLTRWIKEPDVMLREKDPVAIQLLAEYRGVPMPNLGLSDSEVKEVVAFLAAKEKAAKDAADAKDPAAKKVDGAEAAAAATASAEPAKSEPKTALP
jgi:protein SCO1/2